MTTPALAAEPAHEKAPEAVAAARGRESENPREEPNVLNTLRQTSDARCAVVADNIQATMAAARVDVAELSRRANLPTDLLRDRLTNPTSLTVAELAAIAVALDVRGSDLMRPPIRQHYVGDDGVNMLCGKLRSQLIPVSGSRVGRVVRFCPVCEAMAVLEDCGGAR